MAQFDEGHHVPMKKPYKKAPIVPTLSLELIPDEPLTRRGYPRGPSHGDHSGWCPPSLLVYRFELTDSILGSIFVEGSSRKGKGNHHRPSEDETKSRDKKLFIYQYNQGKETSRRDNRSKPYPTLVRMWDRIHDRNARNDSFRELGLGDVVMCGKERWRKLVNCLDMDAFPKVMLQHGLHEIHHINDQMDGRMDACLGYSTILTCEVLDQVGETKDHGSPEEVGAGGLGEDVLEEGVRGQVEGVSIRGCRSQVSGDLF